MSDHEAHCMSEQAEGCPCTCGAEGVSEAPARERVEEAEAAEGAASSPGSIPGAGFDSHAASALSPEAERLATWCDAKADEAEDYAGAAEGHGFEERAANHRADERRYRAIARLLRSPVASTTLPGKPSEPWEIFGGGLGAFAVARRSDWESQNVRRYGLFEQRSDATEAVRLLSAVDGSPVASLAPTPSTALPEVDYELGVAGEWFTGTPDRIARLTEIVGLAEGEPDKFTDAYLHGDAALIQNALRLALVFVDPAPVGALAPTSLAEIPACIEAMKMDDDHESHLRGYPALSDNSDSGWCNLCNAARLRAAEAARPPKDPNQESSS